MIWYFLVVFMEELQKINVIYEDNHIIVVEKPINMPVCLDSSKDRDLLTILKEYIKKKYNKPGNVYLGLVHRLDRPVGGVMVFARTSKAASRLSNQVRGNKLEKYYYAVLDGKAQSRGELVDYLYKDKNINMSFVTDSNKGKLSKLSYELVSYKKKFSLVRIKLSTGRSHQIRVQFSSRNLPLVGDAKYNINSDNKTSIALFAYKLCFVHPVTKEKMCFELPLPKRYPFNCF